MAHDTTEDGAESIAIWEERAAERLLGETVYEHRLRLYAEIYAHDNAFYYAAAGWLAAVGITNMVLRGRLLPNRLGTAWAGCLAAALPSVFIGYMAQRSLSNTIQVLASMAAIGALALATGFFTTLNADDRAICMNSVLRRTRTPLPAGELEKTNECIGRN